VQSLSRSLERVRTALFRRRRPGRHRRAVLPSLAPKTVHAQPTPEVWGARIVTARAGRAAARAPLDVEDTSAPIRPYLLTPEEWRQARMSARRDAWQAMR
jgi:hypothetical protein